MHNRINKKTEKRMEFRFRNYPFFLVFPFLFSAFIMLGNNPQIKNNSNKNTALNTSKTLNSNELSCPIVLFIEPVPVICINPFISPFQLTVTIQGSDGSGFGVWSGPGIVEPINGIFDPFESSVTIGDNLITYTFIENGCVISENTIINIQSPPDASFNFDSPICRNESSNIIALNNTAISYQWDFDGGIQNSGSEEGPYDISWNVSDAYTVSLTVTGPSGCTATESNIIELKEPLETPNIVCNTSTSEIVFAWNDIPDANSIEVSIIDGPLGNEGANNYSVSNLLPGGDAVTIQVSAIGPPPCGNSVATKTCTTEDCPPLNIVTQQVQNFCLYPGIPNYDLESYIENYDLPGVWSGNGIIDPAEGILDPDHPTITNGYTKIYVTYTDDVCVYKDSLIINIYETPVVDAGVAEDITCAASEVSLLGNAPGSDLQLIWSGPGIVSGLNTFAPIVDYPGTYYLSVIDMVSGCSNKDSVVVEADQNVPIANAGFDKDLTCDSTSVTLQGNVLAGLYFQYNWAGPGINSSNAHDKNPVVSIPGNYVLQIIDTQNDCYSPKDSVTVGKNTEVPYAEITQVLDLVNCEFKSNELIGEVIPNGSYQWFDPEFQLIGISNSLTANDHGIYYFQVTNAINGCKGLDSIEVSENIPYPLAITQVSESLDCDTKEVVLDGSLSFQGPNIKYFWSGPSGGIISGFDTTVALAVSTGNYKLVVQDTINNCSNEATAFVLEVLNAPTSNIVDPEAIDCNLKEIDLDGSISQGIEPLDYQWVYNSAVIGTDEIITVENSGIYTLIVSNTINNCSDTSDVTVVYNLPPIERVSVEISPPSCFGENDGIVVFDSIFGGSPSYKYSIDGGLNFVNYNQFYNISPGPLDFVLEDRNGCEWDTSIIIQEPVKLELDIGDDLLLTMGDTLFLTAAFNIPEDQVDTIIWYPADILDCFEGDQCFEVAGRPINSLYARATLIDLNGCIVKDKIKIEVDKETIAYVPNVFSPNGDNKNDKFTIYASNSVKQITNFSVFNRWGKTIYEGLNFDPNDPNYGWDGTLNGKPLGPDVFVYWAEVELINGQKTIFKGEVTLIK